MSKEGREVNRQASVDLNCDLGESFGHYRLGNDEEIMKWITSCNVACGYHAGDPETMYHSVKLAKQYGVSLGAHPGFPDLMGFGRRELKMSADEVYHMVIYQVGALKAFADVEGVRVRHVKPHGALYNLAAVQPELARAIAEAVRDLDKQLILFALSGSELVKAGRRAGLTVAEEAFADRTYQPDGSLTPRRHPKAVIHDIHSAARQVISMVKDGMVTTVEGTVVPLRADTICVHGDHPGAVSFVSRLRKQLEDEGIALRPAGDRSDD
jgi:UPF0271 protein